ncbi:MAG TPA: hypothetical protein VF306_17285, partial [Pirellulales bacterium]
SRKQDDLFSWWFAAAYENIEPALAGLLDLALAIERRARAKAIIEKPAKAGWQEGECAGNHQLKLVAKTESPAKAGLSESGRAFRRDV